MNARQVMLAVLLLVLVVLGGCGSGEGYEEEPVAEVPATKPDPCANGAHCHARP